MNFHTKYFLPVFLIIFLFLCCKNSKKVIEQKQPKPVDQSVSGNASSEAKITATIISIDETRDSSDVHSACYKAPCFANIKIENILRKGSLFKIPDDLSKDIRAFFIFTLHATNEDLFPNMGVWYPGLKINDKFEAIIQSRPAMNDSVNYVVYTYKKIEP